MIAYSIGPDEGEGKVAEHERPSLFRDDAGRNRLNHKGVIAIKLVAAPRYHSIYPPDLAPSDAGWIGPNQAPTTTEHTRRAYGAMS